MSDESESTDPPDLEAAKWVAFLDGEADETTLAELRARLAGDPVLQARLDELREARPKLQTSFDALLNEAPVERMKGRLARAVRAPSKMPNPVQWRAAAAAALAMLLVAAGFVAGRWSVKPAQPGEDWRQAVAEYMELYVPETFADSDPSVLAGNIASLAQWIGLKLDADSLRVAGLAPRRVEALNYDGVALGQVGYLDAGVPVAFCILRQGAGDVPVVSSVRNDFAVSSWVRDGHGFMVIGRRPAERIAEIAIELQRRF